MEFLRPSLNEYRLSPVERKQKQDVVHALQTLEAAVKEFHARADSNNPTLRSRELMQNSNKAISVIRSFVDKKFDEQ